MNLQGRRILIIQQRGWAITVGRLLAKKLQEEGCKLAALTLKRTTHEFVLNQKEVKYELILNNDEIMSRPKDYLKGDVYPLGEICEALGIDSIWPIVMTLRNHVRSYKDKFYYGFKQNVPDEEIIDYVMAVYKYINFIFDKFNPEIIIAPNFVALPQIMFNLFAKKRGVKMLVITDCKVVGYHIFTHNYIESEGPFHDRVDALNQGLAESENKEKARQYIKEFRKNFEISEHITVLRQKKSFWKIIRHELSPYYHILRWYIKRPINHLENIGVTTDFRPPKIILRDFYCGKRYKRFMENFNYFPFEKIKKFVYFPLQFQPEAQIDVLAPYFSNQIETARLCAMSLPDDYTLVVKEHPAMVGYRSPSYIEKIDRTVNVKLIDYRISSAKVLRGADLVISPNSTTIAEAVFLQKPVIQLGELGTTLKLPNVYKHTDMATLSKKIKEILKIKCDINENNRKLENYVAAVYDTGFSIKYNTIWNKGKGDFDALWKLFSSEIERNIK